MSPTMIVRTQAELDHAVSVGARHLRIEAGESLIIGGAARGCFITAGPLTEISVYGPGEQITTRGRCELWDGAAIIATHGRVVTHDNGLAVVGAHASARVEGGSVYLANRSVLEQPPHPEANVWMLPGSVYFDQNLALHMTGADDVGIWTDGEVEYVERHLVAIPPLIQKMLDAAPPPVPDGDVS